MIVSEGKILSGSARSGVKVLAGCAAIIASVAAGTTVDVIGRTESSGWMSASYGSIAGDLNSAPVSG